MVSIAAKELVPVVVAAAVWGHQWERRCVCFKSDNSAVVSVLQHRSAHDPLLSHLLRCLAFYAALFHFHFGAAHILGVQNTAADAISRNNTALFSSLFPQIPRVEVPQPVLELLVTRTPDWGSRDWTNTFIRSLTRGFHKPRVPSTARDGGGMSASAQGSTYDPCLSQNTPSVNSQPPSQTLLVGAPSAHT